MVYLFGGIVEEDELMNYHARLNWIMLATVVGLALFLLFKPEPQDAQVYKLSALPVNMAKKISIVHRGSAMTLSKLDGRWYLTAPFQARVDETKINQILEILTSESHHQLVLNNLAEFGLDKPNIQLHINDETFLFGGLTPITNEQYVAVGEYIYLMPPRYAVMLPSQPIKIVSTKLLSETEVPVGFELNGSLIDQHEIEGWVQIWQSAEATHLYFNERESEMDDAQIKITLQNGQYINFKLQQNETELKLLRVDEGISYLFPLDLGKRLLGPHNTELN